MKSYSAATGYVYQYYFHEVLESRRGAQQGNEYVYIVSADRKTAFPVRIWVSGQALVRWGRESGRPLTGTEEYAVAKMRLFEAFDEVEDLAAARPDLRVDLSNLPALLEKLDL